jgi:hypothetical protein
MQEVALKAARRGPTAVGQILEQHVLRTHALLARERGEGIDVETLAR